jgi:hypothetical protein
MTETLNEPVQSAIICQDAVMDHKPGSYARSRALTGFGNASWPNHEAQATPPLPAPTGSVCIQE